MNNRNIAVLGALIVVFTLIFIGLRFRRSELSKKQVLREFPSVTLHTLDGKKIDDKAWRGNNTLIVIWSTWCPQCSKELSDFLDIEKEFAENHLTAVFINRGEERNKVIDYLQQISGFSSTTRAYIDSEDALYVTMGGFSMPEAFFINKDGTVWYRKRGPMSREEIKRRVEDFLGANSP